MRVYGRRALVSLALFAASFGEAGAEVGLELGVEDFRWREFDSTGAQLLEERGPRYRVGAHLRRPLGEGQRDYLQLRGALYFGEVDYDGLACGSAPGSCVPFQTDADYAGAFAEGTLARFVGPASNAELFAGGGIDLWRRDIAGGIDSSGRVVSGAIEDWTVLYAVAGGGAQWIRAAARYRFRVGIKYPFYTYEVPNAYDVSLEPEGRLSYFARFAVDFSKGGRPRWGFGVYYDSYRFDASDVEPIGGGFGVFQPESHQDVAGLYASVYLR